MLSVRIVQGKPLSVSLSRRLEPTTTTAAKAKDRREIDCLNMVGLALYLLGPLRVELDGKEIHIGRPKALALLAYLAVTGERHRRDTLAALLWPELDQAHARADLRRTLSLLDRTVGDGYLVADRETAGLNPRWRAASGRSGVPVAPNLPTRSMTCVSRPPPAPAWNRDGLALSA